MNAGSRNAQLDFRTRFLRAPDGQLTAYQFGALPHAVQAVVSRAPFLIQEARVDAFSIIPHRPGWLGYMKWPLESRPGATALRGR